MARVHKMQHWTAHYIKLRMNAIAEQTLRTISPHAAATGCRGLTCCILAGLTSGGHFLSWQRVLVMPQA
eukprot:1266108-Amphidinium_carterae.1